MMEYKKDFMRLLIDVCYSKNIIINMFLEFLTMSSLTNTLQEVEKIHNDNKMDTITQVFFSNLSFTKLPTSHI